MNFTVDLLLESVGKEDIDWFVSVGGPLRTYLFIVSMIEFIPQSLLNLMVIISTISTIYQSQVSCKPVFVFILNQAVADFALSVVFIVVINMRYHPGDTELESIQEKCHIQMGIWLWIILISIVSTTLLTLDRCRKKNQYNYYPGLLTGSSTSPPPSSTTPSSQPRESSSPSSPAGFSPQ